MPERPSFADKGIYPHIGQHVRRRSIERAHYCQAELRLWGPRASPFELRGQLKRGSPPYLALGVAAIDPDDLSIDPAALSTHQEGDNTNYILDFANAT
jgi:hypothetical protein